MSNATTTESSAPRATDNGTASKTDTTRSDTPYDSELSKDALFELLQNQRRRETLSYLRANEGEANLGNLAEHIAAKENGIDEDRLSSSQRKRAYIGLYQAHLPRMDDAGVIDYDQRSGKIQLCESATQLYTYLDHAKKPTTEESTERSDTRTASTWGLRWLGLFGSE